MNVTEFHRIMLRTEVKIALDDLEHDDRVPEFLLIEGQPDDPTPTYDETVEAVGFDPMKGTHE